MHHLQKSIVVMEEAKRAGEPMGYKKDRVRVDTVQLMAVGLILEAHDDDNGQRFCDYASSVMNQPFFSAVRSIIKQDILGLVRGWAIRDKQGREKFYEEFCITPPYDDPEPVTDKELLSIRRDCKTWGEEEYFGKPLTAEEAKAKKNCTSCGARSYPDVTLMACGSCQRKFYCDRRCQRMDWKEHKKMCQELAESMKESQTIKESK
jgi:hypothetical protein